MNRSLSTMARRQAINKVLGSTLTMDELGGRKFTSFDGIPIKRVDALAGDEARVT
jgi:hypothetical protein